MIFTKIKKKIKIDDDLKKYINIIKLKSEVN